MRFYSLDYPHLHVILVFLLRREYLVERGHLVNVVVLLLGPVLVLHDDLEVDDLVAEPRLGVVEADLEIVVVLNLCLAYG